MSYKLKAYKLKCPKCGSGKSQVKDSRTHTEPDGIRRRRLCLDCNKNYFTMETVNEHTQASLDKKWKSFNKLSREINLLNDTQKKIVLLVCQEMQKIDL